MAVKDPETYWEEKAHTMLTLLRECNFKDKITKEIEQNIFLDYFLTIEDFKICLDRYKQNSKNFK